MSSLTFDARGSTEAPAANAGVLSSHEATTSSISEKVPTSSSLLVFTAASFAAAAVRSAAVVKAQFWAWEEQNVVHQLVQ